MEPIPEMLGRVADTATICRGEMNDSLDDCTLLVFLTCTCACNENKSSTSNSFTLPSRDMGFVCHLLATLSHFYGVVRMALDKVMSWKVVLSSIL